MTMIVVPSLARFGRYTFFHSFDSSLLLRVDFIYTRICYILLLFGYVEKRRKKKKKSTAK